MVQSLQVIQQSVFLEENFEQPLASDLVRCVYRPLEASYISILQG